VTIQESSNNIIFTDPRTHVALLGVNDIVVVRTGDAVLVCHRHDVEKIKGLIPFIPELLQ
jgi:mannose-1-phosphate guanylyltransferase